MTNFTRRSFLKAGSLGLIGLSAFPQTFAKDVYRPVSPEQILNQIKLPIFPSREYVVTEFGAKGDGETECRAAFEEVINSCNQDGGGTVIVPEGSYWMEGPINLKSNVRLHVSEGATIKFSPDPNHYLPVVLTRWEGTELFNYSPMIYVYQATNVAITGRGTIHGNSETTFATWKPNQDPDQLKLREMGNDQVPVHERIFGDGHWLRPSMIQFWSCKNVLVEDVTIHDSPFWVIHPVYSTNVTVRNVYVDSWNANNDGVDPDSSVNVLVENCRFETGDDSVAIKSGRDQDAWRIGQSTENVVVRNCQMNSEANGLCIGSEMSGGVRNVFMENCRVGEVDSAIYFKANLDRGGHVENVWVRDISVEDAEAMIRFTTDYHGYRGNHYPPTFRDFLIEDVSCQHAEIAIDAVGVPDAPLQNITLRNIAVEKADEVKEIKHTQNWTMENVSVNGQSVTV
ncbi:MAG: glycoside hydrolase family 28 protein [Candidatus Marinimicrobia bacterium]|nr:glycoside hydrolase family 28 protein [Candidatus Neomarinimicrobiota bacterium]